MYQRLSLSLTAASTDEQARLDALLARSTAFDAEVAARREENRRELERTDARLALLTRDDGAAADAIEAELSDVAARHMADVEERAAELLRLHPPPPPPCDELGAEYDDSAGGEHDAPRGDDFDDDRRR